MMRASSDDLDYLATRLHARRSRLIEGARLDELCRFHDVATLEHAVFPDTDFARPAGFQQQLVQTFANELAACLKHLDGVDQDFIAWYLVRLQVENIKVLFRGFLNRTPAEELEPLIVWLPFGLALDARALLATKTPEEFASSLPAGPPRNRLETILAYPRVSLYPFIFEAALDAGYFQGLIARSNCLTGGELEIVRPMVLHEANLFQFMLVLRGRFHFGLSPESLLPLGVTGDRAGDEWFSHLLSVPDISGAATLGPGKVIDELPAGGYSPEGQPPPNESTLEALAWQRFQRLANSAFRRSHLGVGAVTGYFGLRRVEIANLVTLSESIRLGVDEREVRRQMTPRTDWEGAHV